MSKVQRRMRSHSQWKTLVQDFLSKSISHKEWCAQHQVSYSNIRKWQKRLDLVANSSQAIPQVDFIPVTVSASDEALSCQLDIELSSGHKLQIKNTSWDQIQSLILQTVGVSCS